MRLALPSAYADPAFLACLREAAGERELIAQFDRLYGATLVSRRHPIETMVDQATGKQDADMRAFAQFVHGSIYLALPDEAIEALRGVAALRGVTI